MKVAIDGPAGAGKSTVARAIARQRGFVYLDTGAMYRSVALLALEGGVALDDEDSLADIASSIELTFEPDGEGGQRVYVGQRDVSTQIRTPLVDSSVSAVSSVPSVRTAMVALQRKLAGQADVVAEGRDIGTVVFPDAEVKVFLTADARARAHRRSVQNVQRFGADAPQETEEAIYQRILQRDTADSTRSTAPLVAAADAVHIDSSAMGVDQVVQKVGDLIDAVKAEGKA
jgi:pantoate ligase / CMP/dCMP kinase